MDQSHPLTPAMALWIKTPITAIHHQVYIQQITWCSWWGKKSSFYSSFNKENPSCNIQHHGCCVGASGTRSTTTLGWRATFRCHSWLMVWLQAAQTYLQQAQRYQQHKKISHVIINELIRRWANTWQGLGRGFGEGKGRARDETGCQQ